MQSCNQEISALERLKNITCLSLKFLIVKVDLLNVISQGITVYKNITMMFNENLVTEPSNSCHRIELLLLRLLWDQEFHYYIHKNLLLDSFLSRQIQSITAHSLRYILILPSYVHLLNSEELRNLMYHHDSWKIKICM
jgi:hypothetical protein